MDRTLSACLYNPLEEDEDAKTFRIYLGYFGTAYTVCFFTGVPETHQYLLYSCLTGHDLHQRTAGDRLFHGAKQCSNEIQDHSNTLVRHSPDSHRSGILSSIDSQSISKRGACSVSVCAGVMR